MNQLTIHSEQRVKKVTSIRGADFVFHKKEQQIDYTPLKGKEDTLLFKLKNGAKERVVLSVIPVPIPSIFWGSLRDSIISKEKLLENEGLIVANDSVPYDFPFQVFQFTVYIIKEGKDTLYFHECVPENETGKIPSALERIQGNKFYDCLRDQIQMLESGDVIVIPIVTLSCSSCIMRKKIIFLKLYIE